MKKIIVAGFVATGMLLSVTSIASAHTLRECMVDKAAVELTAGQLALFKAHGDGEINILSTAVDNNMNPLDSARVHAMLWATGASCSLGG